MRDKKPGLLDAAADNRCRRARTGRGTFFLIVGPSGAGKDSLIDGARAALAQDPRFYFPHRTVTRPAQAGGERHHVMEESAFRHAEREGAFCLTWRMHGLAYGLPCAVAVRLVSGCSVVANVSRTVIAEVRARFAPVCVVQVTAPAHVLMQRLQARGREQPRDIERRLARADAYAARGADVRELCNDGALDLGVRRLVALLEHEVDR